MTSAIVAAFDAALCAQSASLSPDDLLRLHRPSIASVDTHVALDECRYYADFQANPADVNKQREHERRLAEQEHGAQYMYQILTSKEHHPLKKNRRFDFRLQQGEREKLQSLGFVVSQRLHADSFAELYHQLYTDDMPVYITSDSVLHAWHRSFDAFLVDLEEEHLVPLLWSVLRKAVSVCQALLRNKTYSQGVRQVVEDVAVFFVVAHDLLSGKRTRSHAGVAARCETIHGEIHRGNLSRVHSFASWPRDVDFSIFQPRGHYTKTPKLTRYFAAMTWLATMDFRVDGTGDVESELYQLQCACVVVHVLTEARVAEDVDTLHEVLGVVAGDGYGADSMTPRQLRELLGEQDILNTVVGDNSERALRSLQDEIARRGLGVQAITGHPIVENASTPTRLPTSFSVIGQQFVWSAFVFSKLVYDQVMHSDSKVIRRLPSAVDAAFALFGNDVAADEIARRMAARAVDDDGFVRFRDGLPYASNLVALREVVDETLSQLDLSTCSLAMLWQLALRELSGPSASSSSVFQSDAWKTRQMNTQIASFTQLRHDTILYAKQGYTMGTLCEYAAGFVDPYPLFWQRMQQLAQRAGETIDRLTLLLPSSQARELMKATSFFNNFAHVTGQLAEIADAQALEKPLSREQDEFLKNVMENERGSGGSRFLGWYPSLFYTAREDSGKRDHLVADIHTDTPSAEHGDPGGILQLGVGDVNLGFFVVDKTIYAGPVFSSYEFVTHMGERLTDEEFSKRLQTLHPPVWATKTFLAAGSG